MGNMSEALHVEVEAEGEHRRGPPLGPASPEHRDWRLTLAGVAGNVLEWYDFAVYGYFSDVIGQVFFPPDQEGHTALIESFLVFGIAFLARPLGGAAFGYLGDTVGRKSALENSILLMALPTIVIGCLPSFATVGWLAPILLILCRILQGLSVGGQLMSSVIFTLEGSPENEWGRRTATVMSATVFGTIVGSLTSYALRAGLDDDQLVSWGWRVPFFCGVFGILPGWYLKRQPATERPPELRATGTFEETLGPVNRRAMIAATLVPAFSAGAYYIVFVWLAIYMESIVEVPHAFGINSAVGVLSLSLIFAMGWVTDKVNRKVPQMLLSSLVFAIAAPIFIGLIGKGNSWVCFVLQLTMGLLIQCYSSALVPWLISTFPPHVRMTSVNISYNLSASIVGGFTPALATVLVDTYGNASPGYIVTGLGVLAWIGLWVGSLDGGWKGEVPLPLESPTSKLGNIV